jgi:hypothetical protein
MNVCLSATAVIYFAIAIAMSFGASRVSRKAPLTGTLDSACGAA